MALTLNTALAEKDSNSYVDSAYCDDYWQNHYSSTTAALWSALSSGQKNTALILACRSIETLRFTYPYSNLDELKFFFDYRSRTLRPNSRVIEPTKSNQYQSLQFPRNIDTDPDTGALFIPEAIMMAQCEQAVSLLSLDQSGLSSTLQGIESESITVGPVSIRQTKGSSSAITTICPMALELVKPYLIKGSTKVRRG